MVRPISLSLVKGVIQKNVFVRFLNSSCLRLQNKILRGMDCVVLNALNATHDRLVFLWQVTLVMTDVCFDLLWHNTKAHLNTFKAGAFALVVA
jgi:hypothetical protein